MKLLWTSALSLGVAFGAPFAFAQDEPRDETLEPGVEEPLGDELDPDIIEEEEEHVFPEQEPSHIEIEEEERIREKERAREEAERPDVFVRPEQRVVIEEREEEEEDGFFGPGLTLSAGGGVVTMTSDDARDFLDTGAYYTARLGIGTRSLVGFEVAYIGTAQNVEAIGLDDDAILLSNGVEGVARFNFTTTDFQPYVLGGVAWKRYDLANEDFNTSSVRDDDEVIEIPVGAGVAWRFGQFALDGRFDYRFATEEDLIPVLDTGAGEGLDNWNVALRAGVHF